MGDTSGSKHLDPSSPAPGVPPRTTKAPPPPMDMWPMAPPPSMDTAAKPRLSAAPPPSMDTQATPRLGPAASGSEREAIYAILDEEQSNLFAFAKANARDARRDRIQYWALKIPAIVGAASASAFEAFGIGTAVIVFATIAAMCAAADAAFPRGRLHNVHRKAANEASLAGTALQSGWHLIQLEHANDLAAMGRRAAELCRAAQAERTRITAYVTRAEASLGGIDVEPPGPSPT